MAITCVHVDSFEHGNMQTLSAPSMYSVITGTPAIVTSPVRTGTRALQVTATGAAESVSYSMPASSRIVSTCVYVRFAALPGAVVRLVTFINATSGNGSLKYSNVSGKFQIGSTVITPDVDVGPTINIDTWYRIVVEFDTSTTTISLRATVDNGTEVTASAAGTAGDTTSLALGTANVETYTCYYSDWIMSATDGDYEQMRDWLGHVVEGRIPSSDGTHNIATSGDFDSFVGTAFDNSTTNGNTFIAHRPQQVANTADQVIRQELGTTTDYMEFGLEDLASNIGTYAENNVAAIRVIGCHTESSATGTTLAEMRTYDSGNNEVLDDAGLSAPIASTRDSGLNITTWRSMLAGITATRTWVNGLKIRLGYADNDPDVNFIDCMMEVALFQTQSPTIYKPRIVVSPMRW